MKIKAKNYIFEKIVTKAFASLTTVKILATINIGAIGAKLHYARFLRRKNYLDTNSQKTLADAS